MNIKIIDDDYFIEFSKLFYEYNQYLATLHNYRDSITILINELSKEDVQPLGLFKGTKLVGFTLGYKYSDDLFYFSAMYIRPKYRYYMKKLFLASEANIKSRYSGWVSHSSTPLGINMHNKMGASPIEIKYYKEL